MRPSDIYIESDVYRESREDVDRGVAFVGKLVLTVLVALAGVLFGVLVWLAQM